MKKKTRWLLLLILAGLPLSLLMMDVVRAYITTPYRFLMRFLYRADQGLLWFFLIGIITFIAYQALVKVPERLPGFRKKQPKSKGPVAEMVNLLEMSQKGRYSRDKLIRSLRGTAVQILAVQRRTSEAAVRQEINNGSFIIPTELMPLFQKDREQSIKMAQEKPRFKFVKQEQIPKFNIEPILSYLESEMDIQGKDGDN